MAFVGSEPAPVHHELVIKLDLDEYVDLDLIFERDRRVSTASTTATRARATTIPIFWQVDEPLFTSLVHVGQPSVIELAPFCRRCSVHDIDDVEWRYPLCTQNI